jgi:hypothetical protein
MGIVWEGTSGSGGVGGCVEVESRKKGSRAALGKVLRLVI